MLIMSHDYNIAEPFSIAKAWPFITYAILYLQKQQLVSWPGVVSLKKKDISLAADSGESEPWTQFLSEFSPHIALMLGKRTQQKYILKQHSLAGSNEIHQT